MTKPTGQKALRVAGVLLLGALCTTARAQESAPTVDMIVAEVNGVVITYGDLRKSIEVPIRELQKTYSGEDLEDRINWLLLAELNRRKEEILLLTEAERLLSDETAAEAQDRVAKYIREEVAKAGSMSALEDLLAQQGKTLDDIREDFRRQILTATLVHEHIYSKITVQPQEMLRYYDEHPDEFKVDSAATIIHVFVGLRDFASREEARTAAAELYRRILAGEDISEIARKHSSGPKAAEGGRWTDVKPGTLRKEVDFFAFALAEGAVSPIIETDVGFHIVKVEKRTLARQLSFDEAHEGVYEQIYQEKLLERRKAYLEQLERRAFIRLLWEPPQ